MSSSTIGNNSAGNLAVSLIRNCGFPYSLPPELKLHIDGQVRAQQLCTTFKQHLHEVSESLGSALDSRRRKFLGRMTSSQRFSINNDLRNLERKLDHLQDSVSRVATSLKNLENGLVFFHEGVPFMIREACMSAMEGLNAELNDGKRIWRCLWDRFIDECVDEAM
jgi:hypothetical protein